MTSRLEYFVIFENGLWQLLLLENALHVLFFQKVQLEIFHICCCTEPPLFEKSCWFEERAIRMQPSFAVLCPDAFFELQHVAVHTWKTSSCSATALVLQVIAQCRTAPCHRHTGTTQERHPFQRLKIDASVSCTSLSCFHFSFFCSIQTLGTHCAAVYDSWLFAALSPGSFCPRVGQIALIFYRQVMFS